MRPIALVLGVAALLVGGYSLLGGGFSWSARETVLEIGPIQASAETQRVYVVPPLAAGAVVGLGLVLIVYGATRRS